MNISPCLLLALPLAFGCSGSPASIVSSAKRIGPTFVNDGGPLMVLPRQSLATWRGAPSDDPTGGDYGRAIAAGDLAIANGELLATVAIGDQLGVVLGNDDHVGTAEWIMHGDHRVVSAWFWGEDDSESKLLRALSAGAIGGWRPLASNLSVEGGLLLLHPASSGGDFSADQVNAAFSSAQECATLRPFDDSSTGGIVGIGDALVVAIPAGKYTVDWTVFEIPDEARCILCRWTPAS